MAPNFSSVVAALCQMYGKGGRELFIPIDVIRDLSPTGTIEQLPDDPTTPGIWLRYNPNHPPIEGVIIKATVEPPESAPVVEEPQPLPELVQHIDEWA